MDMQQLSFFGMFTQNSFCACGVFSHVWRASLQTSIDWVP
jgi:hypothetical protein